MNIMKKMKPATIITIAILVIFLFAGIFLLFRKTESKRLPADTFYANITISGLEIPAAVEKVAAELHAYEEKGLNLTYNGKQLIIPAIAASFDSGVSYNNFQYDTDKLENQLRTFCRQSPWQRLIYQFKGGSQEISPSYNINTDKIKELVKESFPESANAPVDAAFIFSGQKISITPERPGKEADWTQLFTDLNKTLSSLDPDEIALKTKTAYPEIYSDDLKGLETQADSLTATPLTLTFKDKDWPVKREDIASWLIIQKDSDKLNLDFKAERVGLYLEEKIAPEVNVEPQSPRFEIKNNKVASWQLGADGYELQISTSSQAIIDVYTKADKNKNDETVKVELSTVSVPPDATTASDIKEIIGTGHSNFAGSSQKRRLNISVGAASLHGLIIKPGEEFSLMKALGEIDASNGYVTEMVIKDNRTMAEYGGGLCQVGTTLFRTALATGLPITARQNHSYRVSYYEPAGTDATIYDPWPDLRFINDTGKNILIQARIEGNDAYFDFWGTKDGRVTTSTYPVIYNIVKPAPTKLVETDELKPGVKKCTERAHNGADAYFDYTVIYPEGSTTTPKVTRRFKSHYVPWQEVCLIGRSAATTTPAVATTTPEIKTASSTPIN